MLALVAFYIFLHTSFSGEVLKVFLHFPVPVVGIFAVLVPLALAFGGRLTRFIQTPLGLPWLLFNAWIAICAVLSFYPRESVSQVIPFELRLQILPFFFCAVANTSKTIRRLVIAAALGVLPVLMLCALKGEVQDGTRFGIAGTSLENPNDLAFHLLWASTLLMIFLLGKGKLGKVVAVIGASSSFWFILKTASRANFITIFAVVAVVFLLSAPSIRIALLIAVPIGLAITLPLLPKSTFDRILSVKLSSAEEVAKQSDAESDAQLRSAMDSEASRMELAMLAVSATLRHPVFGVGQGMFADETADFMLKATGEKAPWLTAHNSYLKISSETGIPGFVFYLWSISASLWMTLHALKRSRKRPGFEDTSRNSICILMALVTYCVGTFFCDIVYLPYLGMTAGLAAANFLAFRNEDRLATARSPMDKPLFSNPGPGKPMFSGNRPLRSA
jgi:O-antigen ligase